MEMEKENIIAEEEQNIKLGVFDPDLKMEIESIPPKLSFRIGEVCELLNVKAHVLRYWETEFEYFHPRKMPNGQRLYFRKDVETALLIKKLLYKDGFSVKGAKKFFKALKKESRQYKKRSFSEEKVLNKINQIQKNISIIKELIK